MPIKSTLKNMALAFETKALRERVLLLVAALALVFFAFDKALLTPQKKQISVWTAQTEEQTAEDLQISQQISKLSVQLAQNTAPEKKAELEALINLIAKADALLAEDDGGSLQLSTLLKTMLRTTAGVQLISLKTLPVQALLPLTSTDPAAIKPAPPIVATNSTVAVEPPATVYKHEVELIVKGNYLDLLPYLEKLQRYPKRLFWSEARLEVSAYPTATLRLIIHTLSEQKVTLLR